MKKIQFVCDRCGALLEKQAVKIIPNIVNLDTEDILHPVDEAANGMHFCPLCTDEVMKVVRPPSSKEPPVQKMAPGKRRRLDAGRVMALHNAGWDNAKIADDLRATEEQVRQCIYYQEVKKYKSPETGRKE